MARLDGLLSSFRDALLPAASQALVRAVIEEVAAQLERNVIKSKFNRVRWGGGSILGAGGLGV